ncbi:MAG: hypothetical protein IJ680_05910, partial [Paludibacteraceae bacterium]|nr:hypothetical protein [Paludibacteraceae bacterium]
MKRLLSILLIACCAVVARAEFQHPEILSFEQSTDPVTAVKSDISLTDAHYKHGQKSLCWTWKTDKASL